MKKSAIKVIVLTVTFVVVILAAGFYSVALGYARQDGLPEGIAVDGIAVGGMHTEDAKSVVIDAFLQRTADIFIPVEIAGNTAQFTFKDAGAALVLENAFNSVEQLMDGELFRQIDTKLMLQNGYQLETYVTYDRGTLKTAVEAFVNQIVYQAEDASVQFDNTGKFFFVQEKNGMQVDSDALTDVLYHQFLQETYSPVVFTPETVAPDITVDDLKQYTEELGTYTTTLYGTTDRITNISLITEAVNGLTVKPGEVLSLNELTGERTPDKGYMEAPAIRYGELIEELGGGICQLSGTLYNAALASDLEIIERHHHTWPSDYLPVGQDATITWPNKDLKIRNNTEWPYYIHATMVEEELRVTIYGQKRRPGLTIRVENDVYEEIGPPAPELIADPNRPVGYRQELTKPRKGYKVRVYKRYYDGETLVDEELVHTDRFVAIRGKYVEGTYVPPVLDFGEPNDIK